MTRWRAMTGAIAAAVVAAMMLAGGCAPAPRSPSPSPRSNSPAPVEIAPRSPGKSSDGASDTSLIIADPCAARLHELSGALLFYYATHHALPAGLDALRNVPGFESAAADLTCPVSHERYIYDPAGLPAPDGKSLLVVYDASAAHGQKRWAIAILPWAPNQPLVAKVIAVSDAHFPRAASTRP